MLVIFDLEGVMVDGEFLPELAKLKGNYEEILDITLKGIRGEIDWATGLLTRIDKLKGIHYNDCVKVSNNIPYTLGAKQLCDSLKNMGCKLAVVSGGPTILANRAQKDLNIDYVFANELIFKNNVLESIDIQVTADKANSIYKLVQDLEKPKNEIITVVDGMNDLTLLNMAGLRFAFCAPPQVESKADIIIKKKDLREILPYISNLFNQSSQIHPLI